MSAPSTDRAKRSGPINAPAILIAGKNKDTYSIQRGLDGGNPAWILVNDTACSRVGPVDCWDRVYEFFEFYLRSYVFEVIDV